jgi:hypothetical protein
MPDGERLEALRCRTTHPAADMPPHNRHSSEGLVTAIDPDQKIPDASDIAIIARYLYPIAHSAEATTAPLSATLLDEPLAGTGDGQSVARASPPLPTPQRRSRPD